MNLTAEQKEGIVQKAVGLDDGSLVILLLNRHVFPWLEAQDPSERFEDLLNTKLELKRIALDFLIDSVRELHPNVGEQEILENLDPDIFKGALLLTGLALDSVRLYLNVEVLTDLTVLQETQNLDEEVDRILSRD